MKSFSSFPLRPNASTTRSIFPLAFHLKFYVPLFSDGFLSFSNFVNSSFSMASLHVSPLAAFHMSINGAGYRKLAENKGLKRNIFLTMLINGYCEPHGWVTLRYAGFRRCIPHSLAESDQTSSGSRQKQWTHCFCMPVVVDKMNFHAYPCIYHTTNEPHCTLADFYTAGVYAWKVKRWNHMAQMLPSTYPLPFTSFKPGAGRQSTDCPIHQQPGSTCRHTPLLCLSSFWTDTTKDQSSEMIVVLESMTCTATSTRWDHPMSPLAQY